MASEKKRRKQSALDRKPQAGPVPRPSKDGDRRRRGFGAMVRQALQRKQARRDWNIDAEPPPLPDP